MKELAPGVLQWSVYSEEKQLDFNGLYLELGASAVLVDPPFMSEEVVAEIEQRRAPSRVILTNRDHRRAAPQASERFGIPIAVHELDAELLDCTADEKFQGGDVLEGVLEVIAVPASKTPGESALYWRARKILILGDALIGKPPGLLSMLPDDRFPDPLRARAGLEVFADLHPDMILVGDGVSITEDARVVLEPFVVTSARRRMGGAL